MDAFPWAELASIGPWGVVTLFFLMVFLGYLVPGRQAREWKDLYLKEREAREDMQSLMELLRKVLKSIPGNREVDE